MFIKLKKYARNTAAKTSLASGLCVFAAAVSVSCLKKTESEVREFKTFDAGTAQQEVLSDFKISKLESLGIKYKVNRKNNVENLGQSSYLLDVKIDQALTQGQFDSIKKIYGGKTLVSYSGNGSKTDWNLIDFLPGSIQAVNGHYFKTHEILPPAAFPVDFFKQLRMDSKVDVSMNCHATAYEVARSFLTSQGSNTPFTLFFLPDMSSFDFFANRSDLSSDVVPSLDLTPIESAQIRNKGRIIGDVLQFTDPSLLHSAVWIDDDLYFEKSLTDSNAPFRLTTYSDLILRSKLNAVFQNGTMKTGFKRFVGAKMVSPVSFFAGNLEHPRPKRDPADTKKFSGVWSDPVTFASKGISGPGVSDIYVGKFMGMGGKTVSDASYIKEFMLEQDPQTQRMRLPQSAYDSNSFSAK